MNNNIGKALESKSDSLYDFENINYYEFIKIFLKNSLSIVFYSVISTSLLVIIFTTFFIKDKQLIELKIYPITESVDNYYYAFNQLNTLSEVNSNAYLPEINSNSMYSYFLNELNNKQSHDAFLKQYFNNKKIINSEQEEKYSNFLNSLSHKYKDNDEQKIEYGIISLINTNNLFEEKELTNFLNSFINYVNDNVKTNLINSIERLINSVNSSNQIRSIELKSRIQTSLYIYEMELKKEISELKEQAEIIAINDTIVVDLLQGNSNSLNKLDININEFIDGSSISLRSELEESELEESKFVGGYKSIKKRIELLEKRLKSRDFENFAEINSEKSELHLIENDKTEEQIKIAIIGTPLLNKTENFESIIFYSKDISINNITDLKRYQLIIILFLFSFFFFTIFMLTKDGYQRFYNQEII